MTIILIGYNVAARCLIQKNPWALMQFSPVDFQSHVARRALLFFFTIVCILILAAPLLASQQHVLPAALIYLGFSPLCHQIPERCFALLAHPWAVCHRCAGIYFGLWLGALVYPAIPELLRDRLKRRSWILAALAFLAFDAGLPLIGFWMNTPFTRVSSGVVFGVLSAILLVAGIAELLSNVGWRHKCVRYSDSRGGVL